MDETKQVSRPNTWMIIGIIFGVISVALGVILAFTYVNMPNREEISAEAYKEAETEYKEQLSQLRQYYEIRLKKNAMKNDDETKQPDETEIEPENDDYDELYSINVSAATKAKNYIYIPAIGKKIKLDSSVKNVSYRIEEYGVSIWGVAKDAPKSDYAFADADGMASPLAVLIVNSGKYIDSYLKIEPDNQWYSDFKKNAIISNNGNYLVSEDAYSFAFGDDEVTEEEEKWFSKSQEAIRKLVKDKNNYEDIE